MITLFLDWIKQPFSLDSLKAKLIIFFILSSLIPLIVVGVLAYSLSLSALRNEAFNELEAVRNLKATEIQAYFSDIDNDIQLLSSLPIVNSAMSGMMNLAEIETIRGSGFLGRPDLNELELANLYSIRHSKYHPFFTEIVKAKGYLDIFLVDPNGNIVYSQAKNDDFATNLLGGPYSNTELGQVFKELQSSDTVGDIYMTDHILYPAADTPLSFVGTPIIDEALGQIGVLIYAIPLDQIDALVQDKAGMDESNIETYLVGQDKILHSTAGFSSQDMVDTGAVRQGLEGITGRDEILNDQNEEIFSAYQPIEISGQKWVLLVEEFKKDAIAPANRLRSWILIVLMAAAIFAIVVGLLVGFRITSPISRLTGIARQVTGGNLNVQAQVDSQDEIGELAEAFNTMTAQLRQSIDLLEDQVQERTAELEVSVEAGQRATAIRDIDKLLPSITHFVQDKFNLHYVQVFLVDDINKNLVLQSGTGQAGEDMLARKLTLPIDSKTTVGRAAVESKSIVVSDSTVGGIDTGHDIPASWYSTLIKKEQEKKPDSLLPETLSELAVPLIVEGRVVGVLDLQNDKLRSFTQQNLNVYEALAVQLSISIDSARQWSIAQESQQRAELAVQQLTREAWTERLAPSRMDEGFVYDLQKITPISGGDVSEESTSVPLMVQDQAIGHLAVRSADKNLDENERALLQAVAQQLAQKAENLRLFESTQQRASREQIARRIIDKVRTSRNIETALRIATEELSNTLGAARVTVDLNVPQTNVDNPLDQDEGEDEIVTTNFVDSNPVEKTNGKPAVDTLSSSMPSEPSNHVATDNGEKELPEAE